MHDLSLEAAERLFFWSNALYVLGALLTVACAALLLRARRITTPDIWSPVLNSHVILAPAAVCLLGTVAAVGFSDFVLNRERASLDGYKLQVALELSRLHSNAEADRLAVQRGDALESASPLPAASPESLGQSVLFDPLTARKDARDLTLEPGVGESLRGFQGVRAVVECPSSDAEASEFADHLLLLLIANGIDARQGTDRSVLHQLTGQPGIHLRYKDAQNGHDFAATLAMLLRGHGLLVDVAPSWELAARLDRSLDKSVKASLKHDQLVISVGPKS